MATKVIYLCGAGNPDGIRLVRRINDGLRRWAGLALLDDDASWHGRSRLGVTVVGSIDSLAMCPDRPIEGVNLIARSTRTRWRVRQRLLQMGVSLPAIIHPRVETADITFDDDLIVYEQAAIGAEARLGSGVVVFPGAIVGHECIVGDGCVIASGAVINARVRVGPGVYIGANASILPEVEIGAWATIGAGSSVVADVPPGATALGVPAQNMQPPTVVGGTAADALHDSDVQPRVRTELERTLIAVWRESLGIEDVDVHGTFFDQGGTSRLAICVSQQIAHATGRTVAITDLYRFPTIRELAHHLSTTDQRPGSAATAPNIGQRAEVRRTAMRRRIANHPLTTDETSRPDT